MELAEDNPEHYWIDPRDGECKKRGKPQFFINRDGMVNQVSEEEYILWNRSGKTQETTPRAKKIGEANIGAG